MLLKIDNATPFIRAGVLHLEYCLSEDLSDSCQNCRLIDFRLGGAMFELELRENE